jgi:transcriptional regulator with XRE-family HTH domain
MRPSVQLDPSRLKLYRLAASLTQRQLAILAFDLVSEKHSGSDHREDMYHKIEKAGRTSPQRARRLADALKITLDDLLPDAKEIKTLWWISASINEDLLLYSKDSLRDSKNLELALGSTVYGVVAAIAEIKTHWFNNCAKSIRYGHIISADANFGSSEFRIEIRHYNENKQRLIQRHTFVARPIIFAQEKGVLWRDANELEKSSFSASIRDFLFSCVHTVSIDGAMFPPDEFKQYYQVKFTELVICNQDEIQKMEGIRYFASTDELYFSIGEWLHSDDNKFVNFTESVHGINVVAQKATITDKNSTLLCKNILILRGWIDAGEKFCIGPWPISDRKPLVDGQVPHRNARLLFRPDTPAIPFKPDLIIKSTKKIKSDAV